MNHRTSRLAIYSLAALIGGFSVLPVNAQLVAPNMPQPTSPYEVQAMNLERKFQEAYFAGMLTDLELAAYREEVYACMDACIWRRMRNVSDSINSRRTMKRLKLVEDTFNVATQARRR